VEDLKENTISDILLVIEKSKRVKEDLEYSIESKTDELNSIKNELSKTKKTNLSFAVDNTNMEMIQNVNKIILVIYSQHKQKIFRKLSEKITLCPKKSII